MLIKSLFPLATEKSWQSLLIRDGKIQLATARYKTEDDFVKAWEKKSIFVRKKELVVADISRLAHPESRPKRLHITVSGKKVFMDFTGQPDLEEVVAHLQEQRRFTASTLGVSKFRAVTPALIGLGATALFTFVIYEDAVTIEDGQTVQTSGRNGLFKMLFAWLAKQLGSRNTIIAGFIVGLFCLYFLIKALQNPPNEVVYE